MRLMLTISLVIGYATIVGWQPSVVRSTVLVVMTLVAICQDFVRQPPPIVSPRRRCW